MFSIFKLNAQGNEMIQETKTKMLASKQTQNSNCILGACIGAPFDRVCISCINVSNEFKTYLFLPRKASFHVLVTSFLKFWNDEFAPIYFAP